MVLQKNWGSQPSGITFSCKASLKELIPIQSKQIRTFAGQGFHPFLGDCQKEILSNY
jgi:hypothetical protein